MYLIVTLMFPVVLTLLPVCLYNIGWEEHEIYLSSTSTLRESALSFTLGGPCRWTKNQIDMRQINWGKSDLTVHLQGIHIRKFQTRAT